MGACVRTLRRHRFGQSVGCGGACKAALGQALLPCWLMQGAHGYAFMMAAVVFLCVDKAC